MPYISVFGALFLCCGSLVTCRGAHQDGERRIMKRYVLLALSLVLLSVIFIVAGKAVYSDNGDKSPSAPLVYSPRTLTPENPVTLDACQYEVTFDQSGVGSDFTGTVVTIDGANYGVASLPVEFWWDTGSSHTFSFSSPLAASTGEQYIWVSTTGLSNLQSSSINVSSAGSIVGNYETQYYLNVSSPYDSPSPSSGWFDSGTNITESVTSPAAGPTGTQYVCTGWSGSGSVPASGSGSSVVFTISAPSSITWSWETQYYLNVSSAYDSPNGQGWYDAGSAANFSVTTPVSGGAGTQYVFTAWSSGDPGGYTGSSASQSVTMNNPITETAVWETQYYLTVSSAYDSPTPASGWFDSGTGITESVTSPVSGGSGIQYVCTGWTGTGSVPASGSASSLAFTITQTSNVTWTWETQYNVTFDDSGLDSSSSGTVATVNGTAITYGQLPYSLWADSGDSIVYSYNNVSSSNTGETFVLIGVTGLPSPMTVASPMTVTGNYKTQYQVTFNQTGVGDDFSGAIVSVDGTDYNYSTLPSSFWWDNGSSHTFSFYSPLVVNVSKQYNWASTSGLSTLQNDTLFISGAGSVTGNYAVENKVQITFSQTGVNTDFTGTVVTIDGVNYTVTALPIPFWWDINSTHTFAYQSPLIVTPSAQQYVWTSTSGLSTLQSDAITATTSGNITGNYKTQYYLILTTEPSGVNSPSGAGWYDAGTNATVSTVAYVDIVSNSSRYSFNGWTTANMTEIADPTISTTNVTMDYAKTVTANYIVQYMVTFNQSGVGSDFTSTIVAIDGTLYNGSSLPYQFWWDNGSSHTFAYQSPLVAVPNNKQYVWKNTTGLSTLQSGSITVTTYGSIEGNYATQYYLTVTSAYDSPSPVSGWFDSGSSITASVTSPTPGPAGTQYNCTGWTGTGSVPASGTTPTVSFTIAQPSSINWNWETQYYLTVTSPYGTTGGQGWYDNGATAYSTLNTGAVDDGNGTRHVFTSWSGDASGTDYTQSNSIVMNGPKTAVANWKTQYTVAFDHSGLDASASGTIATVNSSSIAFAQLPYSIWVDSGSSVTYAYQNVSSSVAGKRFILIGITGIPSPITVTSPMNVTGNYKTQYQVTFKQTGVGDDFSGIIVNIDGAGYGYSALPTSFWWDSGSSYTFAFQSPLVVTTNGKQYLWTSTSGLSSLQNGSITVTTSGSVVGNSETQYYLTVTSPFGTPSGQGWYDNGAIAYATLDTGTIDYGNGTRRVFTNWIGNASGTQYGQSDPIQMNAPKTAIANWMTEYRLIVRTSGLGTSNTNVYNNTRVLGTATDATPYEGWFEQGSVILLNIDSPIGNDSTTYVFTEWSGDLAGTSRPASVTLDTAKDVTANYESARVFPLLNKTLFMFVVGMIGAVGGLILLLMLGLPMRRRKKGPPRGYAVVVYPHV